MLTMQFKLSTKAFKSMIALVISQMYMHATTREDLEIECKLNEEEESVKKIKD